MHTCPRCGFEDPPCWFSYRWVTNLDYARFTDFVKYYPQWKDLKPGQIVSDDPYDFYRRTSMRNNGIYVHRWPKFLGPDYYKSRFFERHMAKRVRHPQQQQLVEVQAP